MQRARFYRQNNDGGREMEKCLYILNFDRSWNSIAMPNIENPLNA